MERKWWETRLNPRRLSGRDAGRSGAGTLAGGLGASRIRHGGVLCGIGVRKNLSIAAISHRRNASVDLAEVCGWVDFLPWRRVWAIPSNYGRKKKRSKKIKCFSLLIIFPPPHFSPLLWHLSLALWRGVLLTDVAGFCPVLRYTSCQAADVNIHHAAVACWYKNWNLDACMRPNWIC